MGTTAEKLTYLNTTKQNLKTVINTTGAGLTDESTFRSYANVLNDKILGAINGDVDLFEEYPKVSGNGTDLSLNGVVEGKMTITPQGVSSQDGEPTPTTPVPVKSVTGENVLKISNSDNSESQTYPISLGNIELCSTPDGTIRDYIYGTPNNWYKREYIGKIVLDGSEDWGYRPNYTGADRFVANVFPSNLTISHSGYSNYFEVKTNTSFTYPYIDINNSQAVVNFSEKGTTTLEQFKAWLSTHNTIVYYSKLEYTDIPITDTTLINQLNDIYENAHSYNGVTNITTTYEEGNEQMYLDIEALKNVWEVTE